MFNVAQVCEWTGGRVVNAEELGDAITKVRVDRLSSLGSSRSSNLAYFFSKNYQKELPGARPGILITGEAFVQPLRAAGLPLWKSSAVIACQDPYLAMAIVSEKFASELSTVAHLAAPGLTSIHPTAVVDPTAVLESGVQVGAHSVIEAGAKIGADSIIYPGCYIGPQCKLGERCVLFPKVTLYEWVELGNRVRIHASATLGADGFGYAPRAGGHVKIYHLGRVIIGDDVEIGANTCIDRGTIEDTVIEKNAKIDNQVHLGHNVQIGEGAIVCGAVGMAGNASVGKFAYIGGLSGLANQVHVGAGAKVAAMTLISKDVPPGETAAGVPQREHREHFRAHAWLSRAAKAGRKSGKESE
jgi:UDP-3-O-[3-hydroxymyristoyl] glucosamine N-acyltransferase